MHRHGLISTVAGTAVNATVTMVLGCLLLAATMTATADEYREVDWVDLIPEHDLDALLNPPEWVFDIDDGSEQDNADYLFSETPESEAEIRYRQALVSSDTRAELDGQKVRIPGFIVPLAFDDKRLVTEFFVVPYFGACLHLPPPPPNQIVHVSYPAGLDLFSLYQPYWVEGELDVQSVSNVVADSAYALRAVNIEIYDY